jgi:diguanylate cyclase (GGDEF)-like protein
LFSDISKRKEQEDKIRFRANYDALTQLANRSLFDEQLEHLLKQAKREQNKLALLYLDLDGFKAVNDSFGHFIGDCVLKQVAEILRGSLRESDAICRMGGDEFVICLSGIHDDMAVTAVATKIISAISEPMQIDGHSVQIGTSVGISFYPDAAETPEALISCADKEMYKAKHAGKGQFSVFQA